MAGNVSVSYLYRILDRFSGPLNTMKNAATKFDAQVSKVQAGLGKMQDKFQSAGAKLANLQTGLAALGAGAFLKGALNDAVEYGDSIGRIGTLIPGQEKRLESLKGTVSDMAMTMGKDLNDIAGGAFDVISAFGDMEGETEGRLKAVAQAAIAGGSSTSEALSLLSAVTKSYGDTSAEALTKASDLAFMTNVLGQTTFPEMAASMGKVLPLTSKMAVSQEEVFAAMASLTGVTGNTAEVSTQLAATMSALIKPTDTMKKTIEGLGYASVSAMVKEKGLSGSLGLLADAAGGSEEMVGKLFGSKEAMTAFFALTGAQADKFSESLAAMGDAAQSGGQVTQDALNEMTNVPGHNLRQMNAIMQSLKITIGDIVAEAITPLLKKLGPFIQNLQTANPELIKMFTYFLMGVTALGAILVPLGLLISTIGTIIGAVKTIIGLTKVWTAVQTAFNAVMAMNPIALIIIGVMALIAVVILAIKHWDKIKEVAGVAWDFIVEKTMGAVDAIKGFLLNLWGGFSQLLDNPFFTAAATLLAPWLTIPALIIKHWQPLMDFFSMLGDKIGSGVQKVKNFFGGVGEKLGGLFGGNREATSPYISSTPGAPIPTGYGANASADASVRVYTEEGMGVEPFAPSGNLGYNMQTEYRR